MKRLNKAGFVRELPLVEHEPQRAEESPEAYAERAEVEAGYDGIRVRFELLPGDTVIDWHDDIVESGLRIQDAERRMRELPAVEGPVTHDSYAAIKAARQVVRAVTDEHRTMLRRHLVQALRGVIGLEIGGVDLATFDCADVGTRNLLLDEVEACEDRGLLQRLEACVRGGQGPSARQKKASALSPSPDPGSS